MVSQVSLQNIIDADWSKQYLASTGAVESRGFCSKIVTFLRDVPYVGGLFSALLPKPDIFKASDAIKREIKELIATGSNPEDATIAAAAAKINELVYKIASKKPQNAVAFDGALINVRALIAVQPAPVVEVEELQETVINILPEPQELPLAADAVVSEDAAQLPDIVDLNALSEQEPAPQPIVEEVVVEEEVIPTPVELPVEEFPTPAEAKQAEVRSARLAGEEKKRRHKDKKSKTAVAVQVNQGQQEVPATPKKKTSHSRHAEKKSKNV